MGGEGMFFSVGLLSREGGYRRIGLWQFLLAVIVGMSILAAPATAGRVPFSAISVDARTGQILFSVDANGPRHPASLTKMMTLYILFQDLKAGRIKLDSPVRISARASGMSPSKLGVAPGTTITVDQAIRALVIISANDVAAAIAENLGKSEADFAQRMTKVARSIGMSRTTFRNASGLPHPSQWTTARDMATLGLRLQRDFPQYYPYFAITSFTYGGRTIATHNRLLGRYDGADGIKTGYIATSGFNLTSSAMRDGKRLVGVVMGAKTGGSRNAYMTSMLDKTFPKAKAGNAIVAQAGSSKGAVEIKEASARTAPKTQAPAGGDAEIATADTSAAADSAGDQSEDGGDAQQAAPDTKAMTIQSIIAATEEPRVIDGKIGDAPSAAKLPAKLPFAVKKEAKQSEVNAQVAAASSGDWNIQIGTYATKNDAIVRLQKLRAIGPAQLKDKPGFTVTIQRGNDTIYRARFAGLTEKEARDACRQISERSLACYVVGPDS
jgi:D-alanyl-D-alanine carboxypeptidase